MAQIEGVVIKNDPNTRRIKKIILGVPTLMKNSAVSEAIENLIDVLAVQAVKGRQEPGRLWEDVKQELSCKLRIKSKRVQSNHPQNA